MYLLKTGMVYDVLCILQQSLDPPAPSETFGDCTKTAQRNWPQVSRTDATLPPHRQINWKERIWSDRLLLYPEGVSSASSPKPISTSLPSKPLPFTLPNCWTLTESRKPCIEGGSDLLCQSSGGQKNTLKEVVTTELPFCLSKGLGLQHELNVRLDRRRPKGLFHP